MVLTPDDHSAILAGFADAGFACVSAQSGVPNPLRIEVRANGVVRRFRLWCFDVTHGGGGAEVRAADEFRVQITAGPATAAAYNEGVADLLVGYARARNTIVAYDRRWLEGWTKKKEETGGGGSPSVQVKEADIQAGHDNGFHHITKEAKFGTANIVTMSPECLPAYLLDNERILAGDIGSADVQTGKRGGEGLLEYIGRRGFVFDPDLVARYVASIAAKPFVLLAGITGTGKSKLAELVSEYYTRSVGPASAPTIPVTGSQYVFTRIGDAPDQDRAALVAVRPDWADNQPVFGFVNPITDAYESTLTLDLLLRADEALTASQDRSIAPRFFLLLDEMNLARVEHYFSDWLSCSESRRGEGQSVTQQAVPLHRSKSEMRTDLRSATGEVKSVMVPADLELPTNVIVTGTLNVDESTFGISPKVLDRAMVIEYGEVDLDALRSGISPIDTMGFRFPEELPPFRIAGREDYAKLPLEAHRHLVAINSILGGTRLNLGYRGANEAALFMAIYNEVLPEAADPHWLRALDGAILQKVLPRLSGNRSRLEKPLVRLCGYLKDLEDPGPAGTGTFAQDAVSRMPMSYRRTVEMLDGLRDFGFTSFFK